MLRIVINISGNFEPGMQSIADFTADAAKEMNILAAKLEETHEELTGDLIRSLGLKLIELEGTY